MRRALTTFVVLALGVTLVVVLNIRPTPKNVVPPTSQSSSDAQSAALYCTGLTNHRVGLRGVVDFVNTTNATRHVVIHAVATATSLTPATVVTLAPYARAQVAPTSLLRGDTYALSAQIDGGGVVGEEVVASDDASAPCQSAGTTSWYGSGFDTTVGSSATLSVYNPTATAAVFDVDTFSKAGFMSPASLQGVSVGAHDEITLNLGDDVVATQNFGAAIDVLRGSLVVVEDQISKNVASLNYGSAQLATSGSFPLVTTANKAMAQIRLSNPGPATATVTFAVHLRAFKLAPQSTVVGPYHSTVVTITPNTAIPDAGEALLSMTSTQPVDATLATGTAGGLALSPIGVASSRVVLSDVTGGGFGEATATNVATTSLTVSWSLVRHAAVARTGQFTLGAGETVSLGQTLGGRAQFTGATLVMRSSTPSLVANAILNTRPTGLLTAATLDGR